MPVEELYFCKNCHTKDPSRHRKPNCPDAAKPTPKTVIAPVTQSGEVISEAKFIGAALFTLLDSPDKYRVEAPDWEAAADRMLRKYSCTDLANAMKWAVKEDDFWPERIYNMKNFENNVDAIIRKWRLKQPTSKTNPYRFDIGGDLRKKEMLRRFTEWLPTCPECQGAQFIMSELTKLPTKMCPTCYLQQDQIYHEIELEAR